MEENLKVRYHDGLPEIDFSEFMNGSDSCGIAHKEIVDGAKGEIENYDADICYNHLWWLLQDFVSHPLRHWNGWTKSWYVEEFLRRVGFTFEVIRGQRRVCYNGKPL